MTCCYSKSPEPISTRHLTPCARGPGKYMCHEGNKAANILTYGNILMKLINRKSAMRHENEKSNFWRNQNFNEFVCFEMLSISQQFGSIIFFCKRFSLLYICTFVYYYFFIDFYSRKKSRKKRHQFLCSIHFPARQKKSISFK